MFILRQYNIDVAKFDLSRNLDRSCRVSNLVICNRNLIPLDLEPTCEGVASWLRHRTIPSNRGYVDIILSRVGLDYKDTIGIIKISKGLSLNDSYWVVEEDFEGDFYKYNLFIHKINKNLASIAYSGNGNVKDNSTFIFSPEFTTNGMLAKCWRRINGKLYLYKAGTIGFKNAGKEPYSEYYAYQIANKMGLDTVEYNIAKWKGNICSTCELFTDIDTSYIPIGRIVKKCGIEAVLEYYKNLGEENYNKVVSMLLFDAIIYNTDRHFGNFGVLVDNKSNKVIGNAPIFDNGLSLFCYGTDKDFKDLNKYAKTRYPATYVDFVSFVKPLMNEEHKKQVRKLINFKFKKHPRYNLDKDRLKKLEKFIQQRIQEILS